MKQRARRTTNELMVLSGATELAVGALTGFPYALAISDREKAGRLGIRSVPRLRQWHLDLIALGSLTMLVSTAVPDLPRRVAWPLMLGAWTNASAFGLLAFRPDAERHPAYRTGVGASFVTVTFGCLSVASLLRRRTARGVAAS
jgi:hypothetical protein